VAFEEEMPADADAQQDKKDRGPDRDADHDSLTAGPADGWGEKFRALRLKVTGRSCPSRSITTPISGRVWQNRAVASSPGTEKAVERASASDAVCSTPHTCC